MRRRFVTFSLIGLFFAFASPSLFAQDTPEAAYAQWVQVSKAGDLEALLKLSTAAKVKEFHEEFKTEAQKAEIRKMMKALAPVSYTVQSSQISKDGKTATLKIDAVALDFFSMNDPKAKPSPEKMKVTLEKENGQWKVGQQSSGTFAEEDSTVWTPLSWGKSLALPDGSLKVLKGKLDFAETKPSGKPFVVDLVFNFPDTGSMIALFFHKNPNLADIYLQVGDEKVAPIAFAEEFPPVLSTDKPEREVEVMKDDYSYSKNRNFKGTGKYSMLFDIPKAAKGAQVLYLKFKYDDKPYALEVK